MAEDVTGLLRAWRAGDATAEESLLAAVYADLHRRAEILLHRERPDHTLQPTALVNEAYLRLVDQRQVGWQDRAHFYAIAARTMRRVLLDHARRRQAGIRGGGVRPVSLEDAGELARERPDELLRVDAALATLASADAASARVVELRFFGGLTVEEIATALGCSPSTIERQWRAARGRGSGPSSRATPRRRARANVDARRWGLLQSAFEALADLDPALRPQRLEELTRDEPAFADPAIRNELAAMLVGELPDVVDEKTQRSAPPSGNADAGRGAARRVGSRVARYELRALLGEGGFGAVYRAFDPTLRREVAIKVAAFADPASRVRFEREAEIAAGLVHPRIVTVHDFGEADGEPYLVQELLRGEDLDQLLSRRQPADVASRRAVLRDVVEALAYAHARGVVHRDVKPANVRVLPDGRAKLLDFGIARAADPASRLTATGAAIGTLAYLAPEVLRGATGDARADVWGLGALAFELLAFRRPFPGRSPAALVYDIAHGDLPQLTEAEEVGGTLPPALISWVRRCLERDPAARFGDAGAALAALDAPAEPGAESNLTAGAVPRPVHRAAVTVGATLILVALLVVVLARWRATDAVPSPPATTPAPSEVTPPAGVAAEPAPPVPPVAATLVAVDASPWGTVVEVSDREGNLLPLPEDPRTPLALDLAPGTWDIVVLGPDGVARRRCRLEIGSPGRAHSCRPFFARADVRGFLDRHR